MCIYCGRKYSLDKIFEKIIVCKDEDYFEVPRDSCLCGNKEFIFSSGNPYTKSKSISDCLFNKDSRIIKLIEESMYDELPYIL